MITWEVYPEQVRKRQEIHKIWILGVFFRKFLKDNELLSVSCTKGSVGNVFNLLDMLHHLVIATLTIDQRLLKHYVVNLGSKINIWFTKDV